MDQHVAAQEAIALLHVNQQRRARAEAIIGIVIILDFAGLVVAAAAHAPVVVIPLPALSLLLLSSAFQLYADVSVLGAARRQIEARVNDEAGVAALIYEGHVSPVRQRPPLVGSVRLLQGLVGALVLAGLIAATDIAFRYSLLVWLSYAVSTTLLAVSVAFSYRDMLRSGPIAAAAFSSENLGGSSGATRR